MPLLGARRVDRLSVGAGARVHLVVDVGVVAPAVEALLLLGPVLLQGGSAPRLREGLVGHEREHGPESLELPLRRHAEVAVHAVVEGGHVARVARRHVVLGAEGPVRARARGVEGGHAPRPKDVGERPAGRDHVVGQMLWSETRTPSLPSLAGQWDGRRLSDHAALFNYNHTNAQWDGFVQGMELGPDFRTVRAQREEHGPHGVA